MKFKTLVIMTMTLLMMLSIGSTTAFAQTKTQIGKNLKDQACGEAKNCSYKTQLRYCDAKMRAIDLKEQNFDKVLKASKDTQADLFRCQGRNLEARKQFHTVREDNVVLIARVATQKSKIERKNKILANNEAEIKKLRSKSTRLVWFFVGLTVGALTTGVAIGAVLSLK